MDRGSLPALVYDDRHQSVGGAAFNPNRSVALGHDRRTFGQVVDREPNGPLRCRSIDFCTPPPPLGRYLACHRIGQHSVCNYPGIFCEPCSRWSPKPRRPRRQWVALLHSSLSLCLRPNSEPWQLCLHIQLSAPG